MFFERQQQTYENNFLKISNFTPAHAVALLELLSTREYDRSIYLTDANEAAIMPLDDEADSLRPHFDAFHINKGLYSN